MVQQAEAVGANAVLNVRFSTSNIASGAAEVMAYGTAARYEWRRGRGADPLGLGRSSRC